MHTYYADMHSEASPGWALAHKTTYAPMNLYGPVSNAFDAGSILYFGKWKGVRPWKLNLPIHSMPFHRAKKNLGFQGPNPLPLALAMDAARIKSITHGAIIGV
jgi:hypothetical protein